MLNLKNEFTSIMVTKVKILVSAIQNGLQWTQPFEEHAHGRTLFQMSLKRSLSPSISQLRCPVLRYTHNLISFFWQFTYKQIDMGRSRAQRAPYLKALKSKMRTKRDRLLGRISDYGPGSLARISVWAVRLGWQKVYLWSCTLFVVNWK